MIKSIPLNKLVQSPRNVRRHSDPAADAELKASIAAHGLLQNLIVRPAAKGKFEVEAGERRRRAMLALADDKILARDHEVTCLVLEDSAEPAVETSLAENFHRLAMNPADEAQAFAALVTGGATVEDVARRFGLTVRFVEGRLRLATLAPVVFEALASGEITLDIAKAFGATSDQEIQVRVFEQVSSAYYAPNPDSIRRMVLSGTVRGMLPLIPGLRSTSWSSRWLMPIRTTGGRGPQPHCVRLFRQGQSLASKPRMLRPAARLLSSGPVSTKAGARAPMRLPASTCFARCPMTAAPHGLAMS